MMKSLALAASFLATPVLAQAEQPSLQVLLMTCDLADTEPSLGQAPRSLDIFLDLLSQEKTGQSAKLSGTVATTSPTNEKFLKLLSPTTNFEFTDTTGGASGELKVAGKVAWEVPSFFGSEPTRYDLSLSVDLPAEGGGEALKGEAALRINASKTALPYSCTIYR